MSMWQIHLKASYGRWSTSSPGEGGASDLPSWEGHSPGSGNGAGSTRGKKDATGTAAQFNLPFGVAVDSSGILYVADTDNNRIPKIE